MNVNDVHLGIRKFKRRKRLGRGTGSGLGKTSGRGHKGQRSRSGASQHPQFQGGAMPMFRRIPKRGFHNRHALQVLQINVGKLEQSFESGDEVNLETLAEKSLAKGQFDLIKILGGGDLSKKLHVAAHRFSQSAREKIEKAGGEVIELPGKKPVVKNKQASAANGRRAFFLTIRRPTGGGANDLSFPIVCIGRSSQNCTIGGGSPSGRSPNCRPAANQSRPATLTKAIRAEG